MSNTDKNKVLFSVYHRIRKHYIIEPARIDYTRAHALFNMPNAWANCTVSAYFVNNGQPAFISRGD